MPAMQANQTKSKKSKRKPTKKKAKRPAVRKVVVRREVLVEDPYAVYRGNPWGYRPWTVPAPVHPHYHYYQTPAISHVRQVSQAAPAVASMNPAELFDRVRAESAALRQYRQNVHGV